MTQSRSIESRVVIVGAGHAGGTLTGLLRQDGFEGEIIVFGGELDPPYHRPPLSKKFVDGELEHWLKPVEFYDEQGIDLRLGDTVTSIDIASKRVHARSGESVEYGTLVLATGADPRPLPVPGADLDGVIFLRTLSDARGLRKAVESGKKIAIVGAGYVGMEVAAVARSFGIPVVIIEREDRILARVASPELSEILTTHHRSHGSAVLTGVDVVGFAGGLDGQVRAIVLSNGTEIDCETALVGIGAIPNDALAQAAGLACDGGILVDHHARTSDPHVLAIGDVTRRPVDCVDGRMRLESIPSAVEQAKQAAAVITNCTVPAVETPWFWSDQFDLKLKMAGLFRPGLTTVLRGDPSTGKFGLFHLDGDVIVAVEAANAAGDFIAGKQFIHKRARVDVAALADLDVSLRKVVL